VGRLAATLLVLGLLGGTAAAFAVTEHLKLEKSPIFDTRVDKVVSPSCGCHRYPPKISFRLRTGDRISIAIVDSENHVVRSLLPSTFRRGLIRVAWNGRDDAGRPVPDGAYKPRVHLSGQHRTILLPNPIVVDTLAPRITLLFARPSVFSPDGDYRNDYVRIRYRATERSRAMLFANGRLQRRVRQFVARGDVLWSGHVGGLGLPPGVYRLRLRGQDLAGNVGPRTPSVTVRIRYITLGRHVIRVRSGARFAVRVSTDAHRYRWHIGYRTGLVHGRLLRLQAGAPGRYVLVVSERGHRDSAVLLVGSGP
jgi:hypothetical protein